MQTEGDEKMSKPVWMKMVIDSKCFDMHEEGLGAPSLGEEGIWRVRLGRDCGPIGDSPTLPRDSRLCCWSHDFGVLFNPANDSRTLAHE